jgi:hypothetical protein
MGVCAFTQHETGAKNARHVFWARLRAVLSCWLLGLLAHGSSAGVDGGDAPPPLPAPAMSEPP